MTETERQNAWDARMVRWWADWRKADFTWDGLAAKRWSGWVWSETRRQPYEEDQAPKRLKTIPATLQHYWITRFQAQGWDPDRCLITSPDGTETYSLVHLPPHWADGAPTDPVARPDDAMAVINAALDAVGEAAFDREWLPQPAGPDRRAQLRGCIVPASPTPGRRTDGVPILRADFGLCHFLGDVDWSSPRDGPSLIVEQARFDNAAFSGYAGFHNAAFSGHAGFDNAAFSGPVAFERAHFEGRANFAGSAEGVSAAESRHRVEIKPVAGAEPGTLAGDITQPARPLPLAGRAFPEFSARGAVFIGDADFSNRAFLTPTDFEGATFLGVVAFHGSRLHQGDGWRDCRFDTLDYLKAGPPRRVRSAESPWRVGRWVVTPKEGRSARPLRYASYKTADESDPFRTDDDAAVWVPERQPGSDIGWPPASLVLLDARRRLHGMPDRLTLSDAGHQAVLDAWRAETHEQREEKRPIPHDAAYERAERAFRTLKQAMEDNRARLAEGRFFRLELLARRGRTNRKEVPLWESAFSRAYGALADYGNSIVRPLAWLAGIFVAFAALYWVWQAGGATWAPPTQWLRPDPDFIQALRLSGSRMLPFGALGGTEPWPFRDSLLDGGAQGVAVRFVATAQSLIATILTFLFALAVRRRFQIT